MNCGPEIGVMFFLPQLGGGGAEMNAARLGTALHSLGYGVSFAVCRGEGSYERMLPPEVPIHYLPTGRIESSTLRLIRSIAPLRELVREQKPDILCPVMDIPAVAAIRSVREAQPRPRVVVCIQVSPFSQFVDRGGIIANLLTYQIKKNYPKADHVIALSNGVAQEVVLLVPALEGRVSVIHNAGIPSLATPPLREEKSPARPEEGRLIVACGRLTEQKGYPYLLKAFAHVLEREKATLWILGDGPLRPELERFTSSLGIDGQVDFLGFRDNAQAYMRIADVFVLSSLWEGFGNVIVEAMAAGTPVVSTNCPHGPGEIIDNGKNGLLVQPANVEALTDALLKVLGDNALRSRLAEAGMQRAQDFTPSRIAAQYADAFRNVLSAA